MTATVAAAVFPVIFLGELPDKTMFASLLLAARGRPLAVWVGAAGAFAVHVAIAVTVGGVLFAALPRRWVEAVAAGLFLLGALLAWRDDAGREKEGAERAAELAGAHRTVLSAFGVIFVAEWGDLTQILTANFAASYRDPLAVGVGAVLALWAVAGVAVAAGRLLRRVPVTAVRRLTAVVLLGLAAAAAVEAATGNRLLP